ncbi:MAG: 23S rRNA (guanosine(2251)-2'-O)-methyltransferase RlmB [Erysipelotrichaceae bacterium]|nr:23S rRNA (guanosine(2251)-2'-O)-methyltransferase RlmB [Erysipelotrichaceae bacterium]
MAQYVYGKNVVMQMMKRPQQILELLIQEGTDLKPYQSLLKGTNYPVRKVSRKELDRLSENGVHQGIMIKMKEFTTYSLEEILDAVPAGKMPLLVMLDGLEDPHNLGAILRTCDCVGADGVIIGKHRSIGLTPTVAKVSTGAIDTVKVAQVTNLTQTLKELKEKGFWVCGADCHEAIDYRKPDYNVPLVLVIGSEGFGISRLVQKECDYCVIVPMAGEVSSLNASVAAGVLLYQIYSQRFPA